MAFFLQPSLEQQQWFGVIMRRYGLKRIIWFVVILAGVVSFHRESTAAEPPQAIPTRGTGTLGTLYDPDQPLSLPGGVRIGSIIYCASSGPFFHVALRSLEGEERIDTWDLSNPSNPILEQSLSFGNIQQNRIKRKRETRKTNTT